MIYCMGLIGAESSYRLEAAYGEIDMNISKLVNELKELSIRPHNDWKDNPEPYYRKIEVIGTRLFDFGGEALLERVREENFKGNQWVVTLDSVWRRINRCAFEKHGPPQETVKKCTLCEESGRTECPDCRGTGLVKGFLGLFKRTCESCDGEGTKECRICKGTGEKRLQSPRRCPHCSKELSTYLEEVSFNDNEVQFWVLSCAPCGYRRKLD